CLVEFTRMAGLRPAVREDNRPGDVSNPAEKLAIDKIGEPAQEQPEGDRRGNDVYQRPDRDPADPGKERHGEDGTEKTAMERHAAMPKRDDLGRIGREAGQVIKEDVADASAEDDAKGGIDDEVVDVGRRYRRAARSPQRRRRDQAFGIPPAEQDA